MKRDIVIFWDLMGIFASMHGHFPTMHTVQVVFVPQGFGTRYFALVDSREIWAGEEQGEVELETIHIDQKFALRWLGSLYTVVLGFGPKTNKIVRKPVESKRYDISQD